MKKLFFVCAIAISALAMATTGTTSVAGINSTNTDTVPKPRDTVKKPIPDSINFVVDQNR